MVAILLLNLDCREGENKKKKGKIHQKCRSALYTVEATSLSSVAARAREAAHQLVAGNAIPGIVTRRPVSQALEVSLPSCACAVLTLAAERGCGLRCQYGGANRCLCEMASTVHQ